MAFGVNVGPSHAHLKRRLKLSSAAHQSSANNWSWHMWQQQQSLRVQHPCRSSDESVGCGLWLVGEGVKTPTLLLL